MASVPSENEFGTSEGMLIKLKDGPGNAGAGAGASRAAGGGGEGGLPACKMSDGDYTRGKWVKAAAAEWSLNRSPSVNAKVACSKRRTICPSCAVSKLQ